jgi:hypothetical protein
MIAAKNKKERMNRSKWATQMFGPVFLVVLGMVFQFILDQSTLGPDVTPSSATRLNDMKSPDFASLKVVKDGIEDGWKDISVFYGSTDHIGDRRAKAQAGQDLMVSGLLRQVRSGFFIDLAANDATSLSNTYKLETDFDWTGLCFEPNPV